MGPIGGIGVEFGDLREEFSGVRRWSVADGDIEGGAFLQDDRVGSSDEGLMAEPVEPIGKQGAPGRAVWQGSGDDAFGLLRNVVGMADLEAECAGFEFVPDVERIVDGGDAVAVGGGGLGRDFIILAGPSVPAAGVGAGLGAQAARVDEGAGDGFAGGVDNAEDGLRVFGGGEDEEGDDEEQSQSGDSNYFSQRRFHTRCDSICRRVSEFVVKSKAVCEKTGRPG